MAVETGLVPLFAMEAGNLTNTHRIKDKVPVDEYLMAQARFKHLFQTEEGKKERAKIQEIADRNIEEFRLFEE